MKDSNGEREREFSLNLSFQAQYLLTARERNQLKKALQSYELNRFVKIRVTGSGPLAWLTVIGSP